MTYTDFHSHILPGADHGSDNLEMSLKLLETAKSVGIRTVFATPHFYADKDTLGNFIEKREKTFNELKDAVGDEFRLIKGCEVNYQMSLFDLDDLTPLCIENTKYMLLELPFDRSWSEHTFASIDKLRDMGIEPILAHIDRYDSKNINRLYDYYVMMQLNASALKSPFGRKRYIELIDEGFVRFIGSDTHKTPERYKDFAHAAKVLGPERMRMLNKNAEKLINNEL